MIRQKSFGVSAGLFLILLLAPSFLPRFYIYFLAVIFVTALLAMSLNLCVGHGMLFQFHHGVFYGVGAYTTGPSHFAGTASPGAMTGFTASRSLILSHRQQALITLS
jgi:ABC-type branched-subunit amino acid transport system permease subunit